MSVSSPFTSNTYLEPPEDFLQTASRLEWRPLRLFNLYRVTLSSLFLISYVTDVAPNFLGNYLPRLFFWVTLLYLLFAVFSSLSMRWLRFNLQVFMQGGIDILAITLLMHASGGVSSGLGMLLVVAIAGCSILTEGRTAFFFAALASLAVLVESILADVYKVFDSTSYTQAGMLGATFFATAFLAHVLAERIRASDALARQRGLSLQYLAQLNEQIVQHIRSGIVVIDALQRIRLINEAAVRLLGLSVQPQVVALATVAPELAQQITHWQRNTQATPQPFRPSLGEVDVIASFTRLYRAGSVSTLILLEDATLTTQRAHQLKLASLGRLTASIAHEVRNPLAAISQAGQLLAESSELSGGDVRLARIVVEHCQRVNVIIENVLQLSRQATVHCQQFALDQWLPEFLAEFREQRHLETDAVVLNLKTTPVLIAVDPTQLHQALWNLCENGLRYSREKPLLLLTVGLSADSDRAYLDICDRGIGMEAAVATQAFEPFFTTERQGTGLGLYIARELCAANRATLHLLSNTPTGCCFRINFAPLTTTPDSEDN